MGLRNIKKILFSVCCLLLQAYSNASTISPVLVNIEHAGTLNSLLGNKIDSINDMTLTGYLNGSDFNTIYSMDNLSVLDLTDVHIVSGGNSYYDVSSFFSCYTENNKISQRLFMKCKRVTTILLPNSVTAIDFYAFAGCIGLTTLVIPKSVTTIGDGFLSACTAFTSIHCQRQTPPTIKNSNYENTFSSLDKTKCTLFVPRGSSETYRSKVGWSDFAKIVEEDSASALPITLNVAEAGSLSTLLGNKAKKCNDLTLTGYLNGNDIGTIRKMDSLSVLNISNANIISGGDAYYSNSTYHYTSDNEIGDFAFWGCKRLNTITIPQSITSIGVSAFDSGLKLIQSKSSIPPSVKTTTFDNVNKNSCKLIVPRGAYSNYKSSPVWGDFLDISVYVIARTVSIEAGGLYAALGNMASEVNELTIKGNLNGSDILILRRMDSLNVLNLADANIVSGGEMYYPNLQTTNNTLGAFSFYECQGLTSIILPKSITSIGEKAFMGCSGLTSNLIPQNVTTIGDWAFAGCKNLTSVDISNVTSIGTSAFWGCEKMTSIVMPKVLSSIGEFTFTNCFGVSNIIVPEGVTSIGYSAFLCCKSLSSITFPKSLTSIGNYAFNGCEGLKAIHCQMITPPTLTITSELFNNVDFSTCKLYVPMGTSQVYRSAVGWGDFANIIEEDLSPLSENKKSNVKIYTVQDGIVVKGVMLGDEISVYTIDGVLIKKAQAINDIVKINVTNKNIYLIKVAKESFKIAI